MPVLIVETPEGVSLRYPIAGAGSRAAAALIDLLLLAIVWGALLSVLMMASIADASGLSGVAVGVLAGGALLMPAVYQLLFTLFWHGQTPGKRVLGIRVADAGGYPARAMQHVLRSLFWPLEAMVLVFPVPIPLIVMVATERSQRLGDLVAGTVVLRDEAPREGAEPLPRETWSKLPARRLPLVPALGARLGADDYRLIRALLGRADLDPAARKRLQRRAAAHYLKRLGLEGAGISPRDALREIFLFLRELRGAAPARLGLTASRRAPSLAPAGAAAPGSARGPGSAPR